MYEIFFVDFSYFILFYSVWSLVRHSLYSTFYSGVLSREISNKNIFLKYILPNARKGPER